MSYTIIAHPNGVSQTVATLPSDYASSREGVIERAKVHARLRGEYVDVEREGRQIAVCDGAGEVTGYESNFRSN
jgi:hypothetical protein